MIKYLGSKRRILGAILDAIRQHAPDAGSAIDLFSGTARVGHAMKRSGLRVFANDHNAYAHVLARCYVEADADVLPQTEQVIRELSSLPGKAGWFTETFCHQSRFFHPDNGARIDAMRDAIAAMKLSPIVESVVLVSLMEAADRVDSTVGVQMAYLKSWAPRALAPIALRLPDVLPRPAAGACEAHCLDALDAALTLSADVAYVDPPYNQHSYLANYHVWESLVMWDKPDVYGVACKRVDVRERKSNFNRKLQAERALADVIHALDARLLVVSFSDEGFINRERMLEILSVRGPVSVTEIDYPRYVGAKIGIHNPQGERVGQVSHLRNRELLFVVDVTMQPLRPTRGTLASQTVHAG